LLPTREAGLSFMEWTAQLEHGMKHSVELANGEVGTVYLCHPFLVHAAQAHQSKIPRFMAQPPLIPAQTFLLDRPDGAYSPVEQAMRQGIERA